MGLIKELGIVTLQQILCLFFRWSTAQSDGGREHKPALYANIRVVCILTRSERSLKRKPSNSTDLDALDAFSESELPVRSKRRGRLRKNFGSASEELSFTSTASSPSLSTPCPPMKKPTVSVNASWSLIRRLSSLKLERVFKRYMGKHNVKQVLAILNNPMQISEALDQVLHPINPTLMGDVKVPMIQVSIHLCLLHISYDYTQQVMSWGSCCVCALKCTLFPVDHDNTD